MKAFLLAAAVLILGSVHATPDCYDFTVTKIKRDYLEVLPLLMYYNKVDWMTLEPNSNCAFYTYGDVFFKAYDTGIAGIYFRFLKGD